MDEVKMVVAKNIRRYREETGLTQKELADRLDVGTSVISNWELGTNSPNIVKLFTMCQIFNVMPSEMMGVEKASDRERAYQEASPEVQQAVDNLLKVKE